MVESPFYPFTSLSFLKLLSLILRLLKVPVFDPESAGRRRAKHPLVCFFGWRKNMALKIGFLPCGIMTALSQPASLTSVIHGFPIIIVFSHLPLRTPLSSPLCWISYLLLFPWMRYRFVRVLSLVRRCLRLFRVWPKESLPAGTGSRRNYILVSGRSSALILWRSSTPLTSPALFPFLSAMP